MGAQLVGIVWECVCVYVIELSGAEIVCRLVGGRGKLPLWRFGGNCVGNNLLMMTHPFRYVGLKQD